MKRTMLAVIVGPTIRSPVSVFASEQARCGTVRKEKRPTSEPVKPRVAEQGYEVYAKAERRCFEVKALDRDGPRVWLCLNP